VMLQVYPRIAQLPLVGETTQTSYVVQLVNVEQDGMSLLMTDRYCFTVIEESSSLASTQIPGTFMRALRPRPRTATLREHDGELGFEQARYLEVRGAVLDNPEIDELPLVAEDPRVIDQDEDGFPGMTVNVSIFGLLEAQIYVVQRVQYELHGVVLSADRMEGLIQWTDEQNVLAATSPLLLAGAESEQDPNIPLGLSRGGVDVLPDFVVASVSKHRPDDAHQVASQRPDRLVVSLALGAFAVVVRSRLRYAPDVSGNGCHHRGLAACVDLSWYSGCAHLTGLTRQRAHAQVQCQARLGREPLQRTDLPCQLSDRGLAEARDRRQAPGDLRLLRQLSHRFVQRVDLCS